MSSEREPRPDLSSAAAIETNLAYVYLTPSLALKLLKPVNLPFVDLRDPTARKAATKREFELNSSLSPTVYLGLADLEDGSDEPETMIVMRRLRPEHALDKMVAHSPECLRQVARHLAVLHANEAPRRGEEARAAAASSVRKNVTDNLDVIRRHADHIIPNDDIEFVAKRALTYLDGHSELFEQRESQGWVRATHGDLRCEHVFVEQDRVALLDCLAFNEEFRINDVLSDIGFLAMDLHRLCGVDAAKALMHWWREFTNEHHPASLAHFYAAYRAQVRTKVELLRYESGKVEAAAEARRYHDLALHHLGVGTPRLILVGGGPGSGKSTLAEGISRYLGAAWLRTDEIRKDLAGMGHDDHAYATPDTGIYSPEMARQVYEELDRQTALLLAQGESVVVDATWSDARQRTLIRETAKARGVATTELVCTLPPDLARKRVSDRTLSAHNPSDATADLVGYLLDRFEPWPESVAISTEFSVADSLTSALAAIVGRPISDTTTLPRFFAMGLTKDVRLYQFPPRPSTMNR